MSSRSTIRRGFQWITRLSLLAIAGLFILGGPVPDLSARIVPGLSPLVALSHALAARNWYMGLYWSIPPFVILLTALWKGRFFCRWICPTGTLYAAVAAGNKKPRRLGLPRLNGIVFWMILAGAALGTPLWSFMDPLSSLSRIGPILKGTHTAAAFIPGLLIPIFMILGVFQPYIWCTKICPLGYSFDLLHIKPRPTIAQDRTRRDLLIGLAALLPFQLVARKGTLGKSTTTRPLPILPPGATTAREFSSLCTRCYACVDVCPTNVISIKSPLGRHLGNLFHPELDTNTATCEEHCNRCSQVCPSGAITPLTLDEKRYRQIGKAKVIREACLAWADNEYCMVCQEYCPYSAIETRGGGRGHRVPRPVVNPDICRGCGACQTECPAIRAGKAIIVTAVPEQTTVIDN